MVMVIGGANRNFCVDDDDDDDDGDDLNIYFYMIFLIIFLVFWFWKWPKHFRPKAGHGLEMMIMIKDFSNRYHGNQVQVLTGVFATSPQESRLVTL